MCSWLWGLGPIHIAAGVNNFSSVISPAEFLSLTAFSICSSRSRVKWFGDSTPMFLHTCTIMTTIIIIIDSINVVVCTGFSELMIIMRCVK